MLFCGLGKKNREQKKAQTDTDRHDEHIKPPPHHPEKKQILSLTGIILLFLRFWVTICILFVSSTINTILIFKNDFVEEQPEQLQIQQRANNLAPNRTNSSFSFSLFFFAASHRGTTTTDSSQQTPSRDLCIFLCPLSSRVSCMAALLIVVIHTQTKQSRHLSESVSTCSSYGCFIIPEYDSINQQPPPPPPPLLLSVSCWFIQHTRESGFEGRALCMMTRLTMGLPSRGERAIYNSLARNS